MLKGKIHFNCICDWTSTELTLVGNYRSIPHSSHQYHIGYAQGGVIIQGVNS